SFMFIFLGTQGYPIYCLYKYFLNPDNIIMQHYLGSIASFILGILSLGLFSVYPYYKAKHALISQEDSCI
ncbi:hypothetical protein MJH12_14915, partial [bacterium]|nr:hypothetical protein [bacterium]